jgi:hypothetical protein
VWRSCVGRHLERAVVQDVRLSVAETVRKGRSDEAFIECPKVCADKSQDEGSRAHLVISTSP